MRSKIALGPTNWISRAGSLSLGTAQARANPFRDSDALLLGDPRGNRDHQFARWAGRAEVLFGEAYKLNAVGIEPLDVLERFPDTPPA